MTYKNSSAGLQLELANFGSGVIRADASNSGQQEVNYFLTDHLGSIRVIVDGSGVVKERNDYYPFGAKHVRSDYLQRNGNRYKYNGKEEQVTGGLDYLDYGWRMLDKSLGRWFSMDKLSEMMPSISGYVYGLNNPACVVDLFGLFPGKKDAPVGSFLLPEVVVKPDVSYVPSPELYWYYPGMNPNWDNVPDWEELDERAVANAQLASLSRELMLQKFESEIASFKQALENASSLMDYMDFVTGSARLGMGGVDEVSDAILMNTNRVYSTFGKGSRMFGKINGGIFLASSILETRELSRGKISSGRYFYHVGSGLATWGISTKIGAMYGGAYGAAAGFVVGGVFVSGEIIYDRGKEFHGAGYQYTNNFVHKVSSGAFMFGF